MDYKRIDVVINGEYTVHARIEDPSTWTDINNGSKSTEVRIAVQKSDVRKGHLVTFISIEGEGYNVGEIGDNPYKAEELLLVLTHSPWPYE